MSLHLEHELSLMKSMKLLKEQRLITEAARLRSVCGSSQQPNTPYHPLKRQKRALLNISV